MIALIGLALKLTQSGLETEISCMANLCFKCCINLIQRETAVGLFGVHLAVSRPTDWPTNSLLVGGVCFHSGQSCYVLKTGFIEGKRERETVRLTTVFPPTRLERQMQTNTAVCCPRSSDSHSLVEELGTNLLFIFNFLISMYVFLKNKPLNVPVFKEWKKLNRCQAFMMRLKTWLTWWIFHTSNDSTVDV